MPRISKTLLLQLGILYYISMFLVLKYYYTPGDGSTSIRKRGIDLDSNNIATKVDELTELSGGLSKNLRDLEEKLSNLRNVSEIDLLLNKTNMNNLAVNTSKGVHRSVNILTPNVTQLTKDKLKPEETLVRISQNGDVEVNRTVLFNYLKNSLRIWDHNNESMAFMHIGKNGGTSFRAGLFKSVHNKGCKLKGTSNVKEQATHACPGPVPCVCNRHYDWTVIDDLESRGVKVATLALLRDPVKRSVSHFYFAQGLPWTKGTVMRKQTIGQYLKDPQSMLDTRDVWQDGQAGVSWFTATHIASWVVKLNEAEKQGREAVSLDWQYILNKAVKNYHKSLWVGVMEKMDQSLELLRFQSGMDVKMGHSNAGKKKGAKPTSDDLSALEKLMPLDMWFYSYASLVHDAKWQLYQLTKSGNSSVNDQTLNHLTVDIISKLPKTITGCKSTRFILSCPKDDFYFQWKISDENTNVQQRGLLPNL